MNLSAAAVMPRLSTRAAAIEIEVPVVLGDTLVRANASLRHQCLVYTRHTARFLGVWMLLAAIRLCLKTTGFRSALPLVPRRPCWRLHVWN
jgi:hypothetical protein